MNEDIHNYSVLYYYPTCNQALLERFKAIFYEKVEQKHTGETSLLIGATRTEQQGLKRYLDCNHAYGKESTPIWPGGNRRAISASSLKSSYSYP